MVINMLPTGIPCWGIYIDIDTGLVYRDGKPVPSDVQIVFTEEIRERGLMSTDITNKDGETC